MRSRPDTRSRTLWQALARPDFALSPWPWRSAAYLLSGVPVGIAVLVVAVAVIAVGGVLSLVLIGLPLLALAALGGLPVARLERFRTRLIDERPAADPHGRPAEPGLWPWLRTRFQERSTWRELGYAVLLALVLWPLDAIAVVLCLLLPLAMVATPILLATVGEGEEVKVVKVWTVTSWPMAYTFAVLGLLFLAVCCYALGVLAGARAGLTRLLIAPRETALGQRVVELSRSRVRLVDAFEAERRRIERDLHDGAQQRLVALTMTLGLARLDAPPGPVADRIDAAHQEAGEALAELRELIRGIHPKVLTDYGLAAAVADVADRSALPVEVRIEEARRFPDAVEATAYFVVCEALANAARHSGASHVTVFGRYGDGRLVLEIEDDGDGGARAGGGSGLTGLADRVSVLDGGLSLSSPAGGPTVLRVEIPCPVKGVDE
ncbi:sensor histidine kinase [Streptomyces sp. 35G-GA-8]|uniref:sensor histidine kinase n=1 Tax=Streptomyces sp. 35G-GA-8 TaxID=2939434 RepID=UPI00201F48BD|nr:sensor histidine kinase [Streptomyces sp. 35G-GA-8]MCL7377604.1 sensor domain-containing protein [Streptomyces sp. 35G-GA-8]